MRDYHAIEATFEEVDRATSAAADAAVAFRATLPSRRAKILGDIADALEQERARLVAVADAETALGRQRLTGELTRTTDQLRFLGEVITDGAYLDIVVEGARRRRSNRPVGPVAVFAASNFPFAFGVAGGDSAAALAAGCPIIVKAHPSHPETSERLGRCVVGALDRAGVDPGTFSMLHGFEAGRHLVLAPQVAAVAFTGSLAGGTALQELAARRTRPIPVYAEMGSVNPVVVSERALARRPDDVFDGFVGSLTLGAGQFCTKPGLLFVPADSDRALEQLRGKLEQVPPSHMLGPSLRSAWLRDVEETAAVEGVRLLGRALSEDRMRVRPVVLDTTSDTFRGQPRLRHEHFGPSAVVVRYENDDDLLTCLRVLDGNLAGAVHAEPDEVDRLGPVVDALSERVGRLVWNGWTTGVEVGWATHHGGPWPATGTPQHTSVGADAVRRFVRPVLFEGLPSTLLPTELRDVPPDTVLRRDGRSRPPPGRADVVAG